jgi:hypothetical protein
VNLFVASENSFLLLLLGANVSKFFNVELIMPWLTMRVSFVGDWGFFGECWKLPVKALYS